MRYVLQFPELVVELESSLTQEKSFLLISCFCPQIPITGHWFKDKNLYCNGTCIRRTAHRQDGENYEL